jgi:threonine aldolase
MDRPVDLRSDTVTTPSPRMRAAMAEAEVGDDWYGDDPTVQRLEERCAEITGMEAAVYLVTGTMANQIAIHVLTRPGHFVVTEATSHVNGVEATTAAMLSGVSFLRIPTERGVYTADQAAAALEKDPYGVEVVDLATVENTHQIGGGTVWRLETLREVRKVARDAGVALYMDGARIFNASVASGVPVAEFAAEVDAMMFCLSKGLGAPIGSVLCGPEDLVVEARRSKILLGAAWRQAGVVAAAGLVALEDGPPRLHEDHEHARRLAEGIADVTPQVVELAAVETNMVFVDSDAVGVPPLEMRTRLEREGVLVTLVAGRVRMVTHVDVSARDVKDAVAAWARVVAS